MPIRFTEEEIEHQADIEQAENPGATRTQCVDWAQDYLRERAMDDAGARAADESRYGTEDRDEPDDTPCIEWNGFNHPSTY